MPSVGKRVIIDYGEGSGALFQGAKGIVVAVKAFGDAAKVQLTPAIRASDEGELYKVIIEETRFLKPDPEP